jgi:raffinose/stachyose/melibiose transport system substrate-binding protein
MIKKVVSILLALAMLATLVACGGTKESAQTPADQTGQVSSDEANQPSGDSSEAKDTQTKKMAQKLTISGLVGEPDAAQKATIELLKAKYPDIEVEYVTSDNNTREQVLKTAISAGDPPTVGFYWGTRLNSFYNIGMCLDLRDYFDKSFFENINGAMLKTCLGENGEIYGIPFSTVYHTVFYNKDMLDKYGFGEPETWDDMTEIFSRLKKDGIFGFATNSAGMQDCLYGMTYAELEAKVGPGTSYGIANGDVSVAPGSPAGEVIRKVIEQVKAWYDAGYWYPGEGGINTTADDANAAFAQGRCAFIFNFSGAFATHEASCDFEVGTFLKPTSEAGMTSHENIEPSVYFIPSNASEEQINTAVEFFKIVLGQEGQQAVVSSNNIPSVTSYNYSNVSPILSEIMSVLDTQSLIAGINPTRTSSEMQTFIKQQIFAAPLSGTMTIDDTLNEMERLRLAAKNK